MQSDDFFTNEELRRFWFYALSWGPRIIRGFSYFLIAYLLTSINSYGLAWPACLAIVIGILGAGTASARIAHVAIAVLLFMAVIPVGAIEAFKHAVF
jgi:hypothetical protein